MHQCLRHDTTDALEDHEGTVSIGGRTITNLRFADDIDGLAGEEEELVKLVERLDKASKAYGTEISAEKTKSMTNNTSGINKEIKINGQKLETVTSFTYLGSIITDKGSNSEILFRVVQVTACIDKFETKVPEGSGKQRNMEKTGCEVICGDPVTLVVQG